MKIPQHGKGIKVLVSLLIGLHVFTYSSISFAATNELNDIDSGIAGLNYNRNEVLAVQGDQISSFVPKEGIQSNGKFIVVERDKKSLTTSPVDISIIDSIT
ncbi:thiol-activated cytolysin family protein, partial [Paenibacillus profundus]